MRLIPIAATALTLIFAPTADAAIFTVNDTADVSDLQTQILQPLNGFCDSSIDAGTQCTLRAAIEEANATPARDEIRFDGFVAGATTTLDQFRGASQMTLRITQPVTIDGCRNATNPTGPCFGIRSPVRTLNGTGITGMSIYGPDVSISGLAISGADRGIYVNGDGPRFTLQRSSLGVDIAGASVGNGRGIEISGDDTVIGSGTTGQGNVISGNDRGISVFAADRVRILGNLIGTRADGVTPAANQIGIELVGNLADNRPVGTIIGGSLDAAQQATAACDGPCNVIAGLGTSVTLSNASASTSPADTTTIAGNHIGVDRTGNGELRTDTGVDVGDAPTTTIGGAAANSRNLISARLNAIDASRAPADLIVRENRLGTNAAATQRLQNGTTTIRSTAADPAGFGSNVVGIGDAYGLQVSGTGTSVTSNLIGVGPSGADLGSSGSSDGVRLVATSAQPTSDSTLRSNVIGNAGRAGIAILGARNIRLVSNRIGVAADGSEQGNGGYGVLIDRGEAAGPFATGNQVGTENPGEGNVISFNGKAGVSVRAGNDGNYVSAIRGHNPAPVAGAPEPELIDLGDDGLGNAPSGPGAGLRAPEIVTAGTSWVVGTGKPGAFVTVYEKTTPERGEVARSVATAFTVVDADGMWRADTQGDLAVDRIVAATQTMVAADGSTSELSLPEQTRTAPPGPAPETTLDAPAITNDTTPEIGLTSDQVDIGFACRLDGADLFTYCFNPYVSPEALADGEHTLEVRAVNYAGGIDATPAVARFTVDTVAPSAPNITGGPTGETNERRPTFTFTGEAGARFRCSFDDATAADCSSAYAPTADLARGEHQFSAVAIDAAGNRGAVATRAFSVRNATDPDPRSPDTRITKTPKRKVKTKGKRAKVKLAFESTMSPSGFRCSVDGKLRKPCTSPLTLRLKRGSHQIEVTAVALGGFEDPTPEVVRVKVVKG